MSYRTNTADTQTFRALAAITYRVLAAQEWAAGVVRRLTKTDRG